MKTRQTYVITMTNHKGGAGKTNCSLGLSYGLAKKGYKVLCVDADSQGNFTDNLSVDISALIANRKTLYDVLYERNNKQISEFIFSTEYENIDLLASDSRLEERLHELAAQIGMFKYPYKKLFSEIRDMKIYDFVIVDTRPSIGGENIQILLGCDYVIIPTTTGARSTDGIIRINEAIKSCNSVINDCHIKNLGIIINQDDPRTRVSKDATPQIRETHGNLVFNTTIPIDETLKQAEQMMIPIGVWSPNSRSAIAFDDFTEEVLSRLG